MVLIDSIVHKNKIMKTYRMLPLVVALSIFPYAVAKRYEENKEEEARRAAAEVFGVDESKVKIVSSKYGTWVVVVEGKEGKKYEVKRASLKSNQKSRADGVFYAKLLGELGIGPKVICASKDNKYYVCELVKGKFLRYKDKLDAKKLKSFAIALKKLHGERVEFRVRSVTDRIGFWLKSIKREKIALPTEYLEKCQEIIAKMDATKKKIACCHGNLNPDNVIFDRDGAAHFIRAYDAGDANIYDELANVFISFQVEEEDRNLFLTEYFGRPPTQEEIDIIKLSQIGRCFLISAKFFAKSESRNDKNVDMQERVKWLDDMVKEYLKTKPSIDASPKAVHKYDKKQIRKFAVLWYTKAIGWFM
jgi:thiamine kinase-like enzyme